MLARDKRLRLGRDIDRVYKHGRFGGADSLSAKVLSNRRSASRAVVVVAKKVSKKAVVRNRLRRQLVELLAAKWQQIRPGCDIVVTVSRDPGSAKSEVLERSLVQALTRAGALK